MNDDHAKQSTDNSSGQNKASEEDLHEALLRSSNPAFRTLKAMGLTGDIKPEKTTKLESRGVAKKVDAEDVKSKEMSSKEMLSKEIKSRKQTSETSTSKKKASEGKSSGEKLTKGKKSRGKTKERKLSKTKSKKVELKRQNIRIEDKLREKNQVDSGEEKGRKKKQRVSTLEKVKGKKSAIPTVKQKQTRKAAKASEELSQFSKWLETLATPVTLEKPVAKTEEVVPDKSKRENSPIQKNEEAAAIRSNETKISLSDDNMDLQTRDSSAVDSNQTNSASQQGKDEKKLLAKHRADVKRKHKKKKKKKKKRQYDSGVVLSDNIFSETLADLLASQGHKKQAVHMYEKMRLIYPEKSRFFAAKIEELNKKE